MLAAEEHMGLIARARGERSTRDGRRETPKIDMRIRDG